MPDMSDSLGPLLLMAWLSLGCNGSGNGAGHGGSMAGDWECSPEGFAALPTPDTARMLSRQVDWHPPNASEGVMARSFYSDAWPEVIAVTTFGESGRAVTTYRLRGRSDYQATHTVYRYSEPITLGGGSEEVESSAVIVFCDGRAEGQSDPELADALSRLLSDALNRLSYDWSFPAVVDTPRLR